MSMLVKDIYHKPTFVAKDMRIDAVAEIMTFKDIGSVIVGTKEKPLGIFSERDILKKIVSKGVLPNRAKVGDYMSSPVITIEEDKTVIDAIKLISKNHIKRLPVTSNGKVVGMLSARSIMEHAGRSIINGRKAYTGETSRTETPGFW